MQFIDHKRIWVSKDLRLKILDSFPQLENNPSYRWLFGYMIRPWKVEEVTGRAIIDAELLSLFMDKHEQYLTKNLSTGQFLSAFQNDVISNFQYTKHHLGSGKARTVKSTGFSPSIEHAIKVELSSRHDNLVDFVTGKVFTQNDTTKYYADLRAMSEGSYPLNSHPAEGLMNYLNEKVSPSIYSGIKERIDLGLKVAHQQLSGRTLSQTIQQLSHIRIFPKPIYHPARKSVRIFSYYPSLDTLPRKVRKALTSHWIEFDLRSAGLAICSNLFEFHDLYARLEAGEDVLESLAAPLSDKIMARSVVKKLVYAALYGGEASSFHYQMSKYYKDQTGYYLPYSEVKAVLNKNLVSELVIHRDAYFNKLAKTTGPVDSFGKWHYLQSPKDLNSVAARYAQSIELQILLPVLDLAYDEIHKQTPTWRITLWEHDGFSVSHNAHVTAEYVATKISGVVNAHAKDLGYPTRLIYTLPNTHLNQTQ